MPGTLCYVPRDCVNDHAEAAVALLRSKAIVPRKTLEEMGWFEDTGNMMTAVPATHLCEEYAGFPVYMVAVPIAVNDPKYPDGVCYMEESCDVDSWSDEDYERWMEILATRAVGDTL
jgi:hypothetical protein